MYKKILLLTAIALNIAHAQANAELTRTEIIVHAPNTVATYDCEGRNVTIPAPDSNITLKGNCPVMDVIGPDTIVHVEAVNKIRISGPNSKVYYKRSLHPSRFVQVKTYGPSSAAYQVR
ncbi:MAG: DUF3060 domain-containing protein [Acinetobacter sp.]